MVLDPKKKQPPGTETTGSPEYTEEFPDRMKMDERTKLRKKQKKLEEKKFIPVFKLNFLFLSMTFRYF